MKPYLGRTAALIASIVTAGVLAGAALSEGPTPAAVSALIAEWPAPSRLTAWNLLEKYGPPDSALSQDLIWRRRGDWERVEVHRDENPRWRAGIVENVVRYEVPVGSWRDLFMLQLGVSYEPIGQMLSAASASEQTNTLALNVAVDVIQRRRDVMGARQFYMKTLDLARSGKSSDYTQGLLFRPQHGIKPVQHGQLWPMP